MEPTGTGHAGERERERERVSLTDAARRTGRQPVTIRRWIAAGEFTPAEARQVERVRGTATEWSISVAALERVHAAHAASARPVLVVAGPPAPALAPDLAAEIARLREEVARLRAVAAFAPVPVAPSFAGPPATAGSASAARLEVALGRTARERERRAGARVHPAATEMDEGMDGERGLGLGMGRSAPPTTPLALDGWRGGQGRVRANGGNGAPFPPGWVSFSSWSRQHGLEMRTVERHISKGRLPMPHVAPKNQPWVHHGYQIVRAYDREQHIQACEAAARFWPETFEVSCGPECPYRPLAAVAAEVAGTDAADTTDSGPPDA